jgi:hypothetical protein
MACGLAPRPYACNDDANASARYLNSVPRVPNTNKDDEHGRKDESRSEESVREYNYENVRNLDLPWL